MYADSLLEAVKLNGFMIRAPLHHFDIKIITKLCLAAVTKHGRAIEYISPAIKIYSQNEARYFADNWGIKVPTEPEPNSDILLNIMKYNHVDALNICFTAVRQEAGSLFYIPLEIINNERVDCRLEICNAALEQNACIAWMVEKILAGEAATKPPRAITA